MNVKYIETPYGMFRFPQSDELISLFCSESTMFEYRYVDRATSGLKECRTLVDVGAHVGTVCTQLMKRLNPSKTLCFELCTEFSEMLSYNMNISNLGKYEIHNIALGNKEDRVGYKLNNLNTGDTRVVPGNSVEVRPLDSFNFIDVDFLKIDAQGTDFYVLTGAVETIKSSKPFIWAEVDPTDKEQTAIFGELGSSKEFLESLGYSVDIYGAQLFAKPKT